MSELVDLDTNLDSAEVFLNFAHVLEFFPQRIQGLLDGVLKINRLTTSGSILSSEIIGLSRESGENEFEYFETVFAEQTQNLFLKKVR